MSRVYRQQFFCVFFFSFSVDRPTWRTWIKHKEEPTHDVVHAEGAGAVLQQPGVHAVFVELMSTRYNP